MVKSLRDVKWKEFRIDSLFIQDRGKEAAPNQIKSIGTIPVINEIQSNNGLSTFGKGKKLMKGNAITVSVNFAQNVFYQNKPFYASVNILVLYSKNLNKYIGEFIASCIRIANTKYNYAYKTSKERLNATKILLPINVKGEPDYEFMEEYIKEREAKLKEQYKNHVKARVENLAKEIINDKEWKEFSIHSIFNTEKGNQNKMNSLEKGNLPLVSAKKFENGYKGFVQQNDKKVFKGNCLSLNNDGDGGAGISYYQPSVMLLDSHCTALIPKPKLNRYNLLFISRVITNQREKFGHGYAINSERLKSLKIMLPITSKGEPDYTYMENYMKYLEQKKLLEYLEYIN